VAGDLKGAGAGRRPPQVSCHRLKLGRGATSAAGDAIAGTVMGRRRQRDRESSGDVTTFGAELQARRLAAGMSLADLSRALHYSKSHLSKIENGQKNPSPDLARRCDVALQGGGELAALVVRQVPTSLAKMSQGQDGTDDWLLRLGAGGGFDFDVPTDRGWPAPGLRGTWRPEAILTFADSSEELVAAFLASFEARRLLAQKVPAGFVLPTLIAETHGAMTIARTLDGMARLRMTRVAAHFAQHTGWMAQEAGNDEAALWWTDRFVDLARTGPGDPTLEAYALVRRALVALYRDDADGTIELARLARQNTAAATRVRGLAALREAQGHAQAGDDLCCGRAIDQAVSLLSRSEPDDEHGFTVGSRNVADLAAATHGWCLVDLGRVDDAVKLLEPEVGRIPATSYRAKGRYGLRLAHAHALSGNLDLARKTTADALNDARRVQSATLRYEMRRLRGTLARWHSDPGARRLLPQLTAALRTNTGHP